jgi:hypothetical protein
MPAPCRIAEANGKVTAVPFGAFAADGGVAVVAGTSVPDDVWMVLEKGAHLTTRDSVSTREGTYVGPGRFRACIAHREESWVAEGSFETVGGAGERVGGEDWIASPLGVARYDVAKWRLTAKDKNVDVRVSSGTVYFWPAEGADVRYFSEAGPPPSTNDDGWIRIDGSRGVTLTVPNPVLSKDGAEKAFERCSQAASEAKTIAASLASPDASVGEVGPKHVVARRLAHAACDVAHLRVASLPASPVKSALLGKVQASEADWKAIAEP